MKRYISYMKNRKFVSATNDTNIPHYSTSEGGVDYPVVSGFQLASIACDFSGVVPPFFMKAKFKDFVPVDSTVDFSGDYNNVFCTREDLVMKASFSSDVSFPASDSLDQILSVPLEGDEFKQSIESYNYSCETEGIPYLYPVSFSSSALLSLDFETPENKMYFYSGQDISVFSPVDEGGRLDFYLEKLKHSKRGAFAGLMIFDEKKPVARVGLTLLLADKSLLGYDSVTDEPEPIAQTAGYGYP
ncbi:MAG: hypothetical protein ACLFP2_02275 [Candidatus Woesearchaeota archaeon]